MMGKVSPSPIPNSSEASLSTALLDRDNFLTGLLSRVEDIKADSDWLQSIKERAANWVRHSTLPTTRDEEWRFTDLSALKQVQFNNIGTQQTVSQEDIEILPETANSRLVFVNGVYAPELSAVSGLPKGILVGNLTNLPDVYTEQVKSCFAQSEGALEVFTALNTAKMLDAAVIWVDKNVVVETPIHVVFVTAVGEPTIVLPRCLVVASGGSQISIVEEFVAAKMSAPQSLYFTNSVTEIWVAENAHVNHTRVEKESSEAFHVAKTAVTQARHSRYTSTPVVFGSQVSRHNLEILQTGEQTETTLNSLTIVMGNRIADTHSAIALNYPYGISRQLHKCIAGDKAHGVFNGKVFVPKPAQQTDASQLNRNLLLSSKARVDTKPQLEITADNVKCAHGATVSQLEDDEIFYLQSRGINIDNARHLLINAFAAEIINNIPVPSLRENLIATVNNLQ